MHDDDQLLQRAALAFEQGNFWYGERDLEGALHCFHNALRLATRAGHRELEGHCRYLLGITLMQLGRLRGALDTLAPILRQTPPVEEFLLLSAHIELAAVAQQLPIAAENIETIYRELWGLAGDDPEREPELLVFWARFLLYRGRLEEARTAAESALAKKLATDAPGQVFDYHFYGLCGIAMTAGEHDRARRALGEWAAAPDEMPPNRRLRRARAEAELALATGDLDAAGEAVAIAVDAAAQSDYEEVTGPVQWTRYRVARERDDVEEIEAALRALAGYRWTERRMLRQCVQAAHALERARRQRSPSQCRERRRRREGGELAELLANSGWAADEPPLLWI